MLAATLALALCVAMVGDDQLRPAAIAIPIGLVVAAKAIGLYDRDQHVLHKSTLDEVPALFGLATLTVLVAWLLDGAVVDGTLGRQQVLGTWVLLFVLLVCLRSLARVLAGWMAPTERCLLVGDRAAGKFVREKLSLSPSVKAELVGVVPPVESAEGSDEPGQAELPPDLAEILEVHRIDRVILATAAPGRDALLFVIRELKALGVKVSVFPEASQIAGSSVELDHLHGITLLGMRRFEIGRSSAAIKRALDVAGAGIALALLAPVCSRPRWRSGSTRPGPCCSVSGASAVTAASSRCSSSAAWSGGRRAEGRARAPQRGRRGPVQDRRRPPRDQGRPPDARLAGRRAAAAAERPARRHVAGRAAAADPGGGPPDRGLVPAAPRRPAGDDRSLAGPRVLAPGPARARW